MFVSSVIAAAPPSFSSNDTGHAHLLEDIRLSLTETFGDQAVLVARGQPPQNDVGNNIGISWGEVVQALHGASQVD